MKILYKYVTAERALACLPEVGDGSLRATQPSALNDPLECAVVKGIADRNEVEANRELASLLTSLNGTTPVRIDDINVAKEQYGSLFLRELLTRQLSQRFGIVSFTTDPRHPLMWAHYTIDGSGFVIGYDADQIRTLTGKDSCLQSVRYEIRPLPISVYGVLNEDNVNTLLSFKSQHWSYEDEQRLIVELNETVGTGKLDRHGLPINLQRIPNPAVVSVYHTERTPREEVEAISERLANPNNRYRASCLTKLVLSMQRYGYEDQDPTAPQYV